MAEKIGLESVFETDRFKKGLDDYLAGIKKAEGKTASTAANIGTGIAKGVGSFIKTAGIAAIAGITAAAVGLGAVFAQAIPAASDLNETVSKTQVVFGEAADTVFALGETSASALGLSKNAALSAAATYGNLFRSMGITETKSADMSTELVKLAADLASFNNQDPTVVLEKLRSGLTGETEPLKSLGVNLNAAGIAAKAMELGLVPATINVAELQAANVRATKAQEEYNRAVKVYGQDSDNAILAFEKLTKANEAADKAAQGSTDNLTAAQKAQASYALILEQTALAQGDFERTSDGLANQQRILAAQIEDTKAKIGSALLPVVNKLIKVFTKLFENPKVQAGLDAIVAGISRFSDVLGIVIDKLLAGDVSGALSTIFGPDTANTITGIANAISTFAGWLSANLFPVLATLGALILGFMVPAFVAWAGTAVTAAGATIAALAPVVLPVLAIAAAIGLLAAAWQNDWGGIRTTLTDVWNNNLAPIFQTVKEWLETNIPVALQFLSDIWTNTLLPAITSVWAWMTSTLFPFFQSLADFISAVLSVAITALADLWTNKLLPAFTAVADYLSKTLQPVMDGIAKFINETLIPAVSSLVTWVGDKLTEAWNKITSALQKAADWLDAAAEKLRNLGKTDAGDLQPGSPTPFEIGVRGINKALDEMANFALPRVSSKLSNINSPVSAQASGATAATTSNINTTNVIQVGGNTINNGMDSAVFEARVIQIVRGLLPA